MKSVKWFLLLVTLVIGGLLLTACSQSDTNPATPGANPPTPAGSNASSASSPSEPPPYRGAVDRKSCDVVAGWVVAKDSQAQTKVEFYIDDKLIETAPATTLRPEMTSWGNGLHGFSFKIPAAYKDGSSHIFRVKVAGSNYEVPRFQIDPHFECKAS